MNQRAHTDRREWLRAVGRLSLAVGLGGGVTALALRHGGPCGDPGLCGGCATLDHCDRPNAEATRQAIRSEQGHTDARQPKEDDSTRVRA